MTNIETQYDISDVRQVIVCGGGIELASDPFPGTIQFDTTRSCSSYERAVKVAYAAKGLSEEYKPKTSKRGRF